jgi:hypothetical protein
MNEKWLTEPERKTAIELFPLGIGRLVEKSLAS